MRKLLMIPVISFLIGMSSISLAYASHLGPIVFGQERFEGVMFCLSLEHALAIARQDEASIQANESVKEVSDKTEQLAQEGGCDVGNIVYTPMQTLHQWKGGTFIRDFKGQMSIVKSRSHNIDIYVFTADEAPAPPHQPKL